MDDHLAKPYTRQQLAAMLGALAAGRAWSSDRRPRGRRRAAAPAAADGRGACSLDQSVLDNIRAIDEDGTVLNEVIQMFLDEVPAARGRSCAQALAAGRRGAARPASRTR